MSSSPEGDCSSRPEIPPDALAYLNSVPGETTSGYSRGFHFGYDPIEFYDKSTGCTTRISISGPDDLFEMGADNTSKHNHVFGIFVDEKGDPCLTFQEVEEGEETKKDEGTVGSWKIRMVPTGDDTFCHNYRPSDGTPLSIVVHQQRVEPPSDPTSFNTLTPGQAWRLGALPWSADDREFGRCRRAFLEQKQFNLGNVSHILVAPPFPPPPPFLRPSDESFLS